MSRSSKGAPRCPSPKCDWCGGLASAQHRHARQEPVGIADELAAVDDHDPEDDFLMSCDIDDDGLAAEAAKS